MSSNQIHSDVVAMSTASNVFLNEEANTTIQKKHDESYPSTTSATHPSQNLNSTATATATVVNEKPMDKMMFSRVHIEIGQCTREDFLYNSDIISLSGENDGNMVTHSNSTTSCNNTTTSSFSPTRSTADLEKPIPANILFDNGESATFVAATPATLATPKRRGIMLHTSLFFSPLPRLDTTSSSKNKTSTSKSKKHSSSLLATRYGNASASKNKRNKKRKTTPNSQKKSYKTTHNDDDDVLDQITHKHRDTTSNIKRKSANSKQSRDKNIDLEKESDMANSTPCLDQTNVLYRSTFSRRIQIPTSAIEYGTQFSIETFQWKIVFHILWHLWVFEFYEKKYSYTKHLFGPNMEYYSPYHSLFLDQCSCLYFV